MTEPEYLDHLRLASAMLSRGDITVAEFEEHCIAACVCYRGPPPEGREYIACTIGNRIAIAHKAIEQPSNPLSPTEIVTK